MEIEKRLGELEENNYRKASCEKKLEDAGNEYIYLNEKKSELHKQLSEEDYNLKKIESQSIIFLWYDLFAAKGKGVSKKAYDYKVYYDLTKLISPEMLELKKRIEQFQESEEEYRKLSREKDSLLVESEKAMVNQKAKLNQEIAKYKSHMRDINETINIGKNLRASLEYLLDLMKKARDWDTLDIFGRGLFVSLTNTDLFKEAEEKVRNLHYLADKFRRYLEQVGFYMDIKTDITGMKRFCDYFGTQLYFDLTDKGKLKNTIDEIHEGHKVLNENLDSLFQLKEVYLKRVMDLEKQNWES